MGKFLRAGTEKGLISFAAGERWRARKGLIAAFKWTNPHAWLYIDGGDDSGRAAHWRFEMGSPNGRLNRGWRRTELKKGAAITVEGYGAKNGRDGPREPGRVSQRWVFAFGKDRAAMAQSRTEK